MSVATLEQLRLAIRDLMAPIAGIGVIQPYERYAKREPDFARLFMTPATDTEPSRLCGWTIRRVATREFVHSSLKNRVELDFQLRGFMAIEDERQTEILMDGLVEKLRAAFRRDPELGGLLDAPLAVTGAPVGLQLVESQPYMLGGVLCHGVRLNFTGGLITPIAADPADWDDFRIFHASWDMPAIGGAPDSANLVTLLGLQETP